MVFIFESACNDLIAFIVIIIACLYYYVSDKFQYWKKRNVKYEPPIFPFGNFTDSILQKHSIGEIVANIYNTTDAPIIGIFSGLRPKLVLRDPNLIRSVFIKDFQHFHDRGFPVNEKNDPLSGHLFSLGGEKWRNLRVKLSPVFTSGKLKAMFQTLVDCGKPLRKYLGKIDENQETIEMRDLSARYTTDIIASVAFGHDVNSIDNPETEFRKYGRKVFKANWKRSLKRVAIVIYPKIGKLIHMKTVDDDVEEFIMSMVKETLDYREKNNISRKDFFQLLIQLRNTGEVENDGKWDTDIVKDETQKTFTFNELAAQVWIFYLAGFETSSTVMSYCLYELAKNPDIQKKVQLEIDEILQKHDNKITYDAIHDMKYLECCIDETLRKYPPIPILHRECTKTYQIPNTNYTIEKGVQVMIPVLGLQRDPKYYPEPLKFIPERFDSENVFGKTFTDMPYMPFGEGPRVCIGMRMGKMQTKVGLTVMLQYYDFHLDKNTKNEIQFEPTAFVLEPKGGLNFKLTKRNRN